MMMNGMGTGTGAAMIAGYRLADWATGLILLLLSILIVALVGSFLAVAVDFIRGVIRKNELRPEESSSTEGRK